MLEPTQFYLFITASLIVLFVPGSAVFYIIACSVNQGRVAGIVSVLGLELACLIHVTATAIGISMALLSSLFVFNLIKYLGAVYLIYLGVHQLRSRQVMQPIKRRRANLKQTFWQGVVVGVLNPATALFFLAFLPQFVRPAQSNVILQTLLLGSLFVLLAIVVEGFYALVAASAGYWLRENRLFLKGQSYFAAGAYIGLSLMTILSR